MNISRTFGVGAAEALQAARPTNAPSFGEAAAAPPAGMTPVDQLDFSPEAQAILAGGEVEDAGRTERIAQIRREIADGTYDSPERLSAALDRFIDVLG